MLTNKLLLDFIENAPSGTLPYSFHEAVSKKTNGHIQTSWFGRDDIPHDLALEVFRKGGFKGTVIPDNAPILNKDFFFKVVNDDSFKYSDIIGMLFKRAKSIHTDSSFTMDDLDSVLEEIIDKRDLDVIESERDALRSFETILINYSKARGATSVRVFDVSEQLAYISFKEHLEKYAARPIFSDAAWHGALRFFEDLIRLDKFNVSSKLFNNVFAKAVPPSKEMKSYFKLREFFCESYFPFLEEKLAHCDIDDFEVNTFKVAALFWLGEDVDSLIDVYGCDAEVVESLKIFSNEPDASILVSRNFTKIAAIRLLSEKLPSLEGAALKEALIFEKSFLNDADQFGYTAELSLSMFPDELIVKIVKLDAHDASFISDFCADASDELEIRGLKDWSFYKDIPVKQLDSISLTGSSEFFEGIVNEVEDFNSFMVLSESYTGTLGELIETCNKLN